MPIAQTDQVFNLVKSLNKSEKRSFKLYLKRVQKDGKPLFVTLFEQLDQMKVFDERLLKKRMGEFKPSQFANLKRNLYYHILTCLKLLATPKKINIQIRELLDFAELLYDRGLYLQALKILNKAKKQAQESQYDVLHLETMEFEKRIESRHITRTGPSHNEQLAEESSIRGKVVANSAALSSLKQRLHSWFIRNGHVRNDTEKIELVIFFHSYLPNSQRSITFFEKIYLYFSYVWYYHILLDFEKVIEYTNKWIDLYQQQPIMLEKDPILYLRGLHYLLIASWYCKNHSQYAYAIESLKNFEEAYQKRWGKNVQVLAFTYSSYAQLNRIFWEGDIQKGLSIAPKILEDLKEYHDYLDAHKIMIVHYKLAWLYFCSEQKEQALIHLTVIFNHESAHLREDLQIYAQLLALLTHYDLQNYSILTYRLLSCERFLKKAKNKDALQILILKLLKKLNSAKNQNSIVLFQQALSDAQNLQKDVYLRRSFTYLDFILWLEHKLSKKSMESILQSRFLASTVVK